jgi:hypothetical protein
VREPIEDDVIMGNQCGAAFRFTLRPGYFIAIVERDNQDEKGAGMG